MNRIAWIAVALGLWIRAADVPVAVVESVKGRTLLQAADRPSGSAAAPYQWLTAGTVVSVDPDAQITLILNDGSRWMLQSGAEARILPNGVETIRGRGEKLSALPPIPRMPKLAESRAAGAVRLRGDGRFSAYYPDGRANLLATSARFTFAAVAGATAYQVTATDDGGDEVFSARTSALQVQVPADTLRPGAVYNWSVRAIGAAGVVAEARATFGTLSETQSLERDEFRASVVSRMPRPAALALMAEVDSRLGLLAEARQELAEALQLSPGDASLRAAMDRLESLTKDP